MWATSQETQLPTFAGFERIRPTFGPQQVVLLSIFDRHHIDRVVPFRSPEIVALYP
jgi:hypothetical protein